jgi:hypothetical protein
MTAPLRMRPADERRREENRGLGTLSGYLPWIVVQDFSSRGLSSRDPGMKTGRVHHFLSQVETGVFHLLDWSPFVVDIREQFPLLPLDATVDIAARLSLTHPTVPGTKTFPVCTTDLLVTLRYDGREWQEALSCKPSSELDNLRTLDKLELERRYWLERGIEFRLITELDISADVLANAKWVRGMADVARLSLPPGYEPAELIAHLFAELTATPASALSAVCRKVDDRLGLDIGSSLSLARHALAVGWWDANRKVRWDPAHPLPMLTWGGNGPSPQLKSVPSCLSLSDGHHGDAVTSS